MQEQALPSISPQVRQPAQEQMQRPPVTRRSRQDRDQVRFPACLRPVEIPTGSDRPATLEACVLHISSLRDCPQRLVKDARSAVSAVTRVTRQRPEDLPADPQLLRPILGEIMPAAHRMSRKRWANIRSELRALLFHCGWIAPENQPRAPLSHEWSRFLEIAKQHLDKASAPLRPFARACAACGLSPERVTTADLAAYETAREASSLDGHPRQTAMSVQSSWNRLIVSAGMTELPKLQLTSRVMSKMQNSTELPESFQSELRAYLDFCRNGDPLRDFEPISLVTMGHARRAILRGAAHLVGSGQKTVAEIDSLAVLVSPRAFGTIMTRVYDECGQRWTSVAVNISGQLMGLARKWTNLPSNDLKEVERIHRKVKIKHTGLSRRTRNRLTQFATTEERKELFELPDKAFQHAEELVTRDYRIRGAKLYQTSLSLAILLTQPIRLRNLTSLNMQAHFVRNRQGDVTRIFIEADQVKNCVDIDVIIPDKLAQHIRRYVTVFRPLIPGHDAGSALFPGPNGSPLSSQSVGRHLERLVREQLGAKFTPHLSRHLAADILLDDDPDNLGLCQRLLGHTSPRTTEALYGRRRTSSAQRKYSGIVDSLVQTAERQKPTSKGRSRK